MLLFLEALTDKDTLHSYPLVYERYAPGRCSKGKKVLEIGVQRGGSILTWASLGAEVWGIDIDESPGYLKHPRIHCVKGNAYSLEAIQHFKSLGVKFDMIVEDGSHKPEDILWAAQWYSELLSEDGVMILEDIPNAEVVEKLKEIQGFFTIDYDLRKVKGRWDDRVVVLERIPRGK